MSCAMNEWYQQLHTIARSIFLVSFGINRKFSAARGLSGQAFQRGISKDNVKSKEILLDGHSYVNKRHLIFFPIELKIETILMSSYVCMESITLPRNVIK